MPRNHKTGGETYTPVSMPERQHSQHDLRTPTHPETEFETGLKSKLKVIGIGAVVFGRQAKRQGGTDETGTSCH